MRARFDVHVVVEVGEVTVFLSQPPHSPRFARLARRPVVHVVVEVVEVSVFLS